MALFPIGIKMGLNHLQTIEDSWYLIFRCPTLAENNYILAQAVLYVKKGISSPKLLDLKARAYTTNQLLDLTYQIFISEGKGSGCSDTNLSTLSLHTQLKDLLDHIYSVYKDSNLVLLILADYYFRKYDQFSTAYDILHRVIASKHVSNAERLSALCMISEMQTHLLLKQQAHRNQKVDLIHFVNAMENYNKLGGLISEQLDSREKLYLLLEQETPCLLSVANFSHKIQRIQQKTSKIWEQLSEKSLEEYPPLIKIYALFVIFVELQHDK